MKGFTLLLSFCILFFQAAHADIQQDQVIHTSIRVAETFAVDENLTIPKSFKQGIKAVAIIPDVVKTGFLATAHQGVGIFSVKNEKNQWSPPLIVRFRGLGVGIQAGYQSGDIVFLFRNRRSFTDIFNGADTLDFGTDATMGERGYSKSFLTDLPAISADVVALGRSNGIFIGMSIDGSRLHILDQETIDYYGRLYKVKDILNGSAKKSQLTKKLLQTLKKTF